MPSKQGGQWGFTKYRPPKKPQILTKYRPQKRVISTKYWPQKRVLNRLLWSINFIVFLKTYNLFVLLIGTAANNSSYTKNHNGHLLAKWSIIDQWSIISTHWPAWPMVSIRSMKVWYMLPLLIYLTSSQEAGKQLRPGRSELRRITCNENCGTIYS